MLGARAVLVMAESGQPRDVHADCMLRIQIFEGSCHFLLVSFKNLHNGSEQNDIPVQLKNMLTSRACCCMSIRSEQVSMLASIALIYC